MGKEMYIKVIANDSSVDNFYEIYNPLSKVNIMCSKDNENLVNIKDAEMVGADKLRKALVIMLNDIDEAHNNLYNELFNGECFLGDILSKFSAEEIIKQIERVNEEHKPKVGDIYTRKNNKELAIIVEVKKDNSVKLMKKGSDGIYISLTSYLNEYYDFLYHSDSDIECIVKDILKCN